MFQPIWVKLKNGISKKKVNNLAFIIFEFFCKFNKKISALNTLIEAIFKMEFFILFVVLYNSWKYFAQKSNLFADTKLPKDVA